MKREAIFPAVFDPRSSFFAPNIARKRLLCRLDKRSNYPGNSTGKKQNIQAKIRKSVNGLNCEVRGEMTVSAGVIFQLIILQQTKTVPYYSYDKPDIKLANRIVLQNQKCFCIPESGFHCMSRENSWCGTYRVLKNQEFLTRPNALVVLSSKMAG